MSSVLTCEEGLRPCRRRGLTRSRDPGVMRYSCSPREMQPEPGDKIDHLKVFVFVRRQSPMRLIVVARGPQDFHRMSTRFSPRLEIIRVHDG